jgi:hypothetical protein
MPTSTADTFVAELKGLAKTLRAAKRYRYNIASNRVYAPKARAGLAALRKSFLLFKRDYPEARFPRIAFHIAAIEPLVTKVVEMFPSEPDQILRLLDELSFKVDSDLAAELESPEAQPTLAHSVPFIPNDIIGDRHGVLQKVLWEANRCYEAACYNACAAMLRRLVESLIIEAYEHHGIAYKIKEGTEFVQFGALIGKSCAEAALRLTTSTKRLLPQLKFLGDLGVHNRMALVRKDDLDRLHNALRGGIEEFTGNI